MRTQNGSTASDVEAIQRINSMEEAQALEDELATPSIFRETTERCFRMGGIHMKDMVSKLLCSFMTKNLMCQYNMHGQRGKVAFKSTRLCNVIRDSVLKKFRDASVTQVQMMIATKLRNAPKIKETGI